jgi:glycosyltransferase involved in cell wall biosynthesis
VVTLLILAYNEENFIEKTVRKYINEFKEIIIIDDSSKDRTYSICKKLQDEYDNIKIIKNSKNLGAGKSFEVGAKYFLNSESDFLLKIDGDDQFKYSDIVRIKKLSEKVSADFIKCDRFWENGIEGKIPKIRYLGNTFASVLLKFLTGNWKINDPLNGLFLISRKGLIDFKLPKIFYRYGYPFYISTYLSNISFEKEFHTIQIKNTISYAGQNSNLSAVTMFFKLLFFTFSIFLKKMKIKLRFSSLQVSAVLDILGFSSLIVSIYCLAKFLLIRYGSLVASQTTWFLVFLIFFFTSVYLIFHSQKAEYKYKLKFFKEL